MSDLPTVHILYENPDWMPPLTDALEAEGFEYRNVFIDSGLIEGRPPEGIWLNRMSPSSHTRSHGRSVALTREILAWLEAHSRRVVNGQNAFELEMSKFQQYLTLQKYGIETPRTALAVGRQELVEVASTFDDAFITKHNRGGKGLGIELFESAAELEAHLSQTDFDLGPNDQVLIQRYIDSPNGYITRAEFVGGRLILAMQSSTDDGFELCPADTCEVPDNSSDAATQTEEADETFAPAQLAADDPLVEQYRALCAGEDIEIAGIEFVEGADGTRYTYDINSTTNYNPNVGEQVGVDGMREVAGYLREVVAPQVRGEDYGSR